MASIEKVIDLMVANGESEETILEVINHYNQQQEQKKVTPSPDATEDVEDGASDGDPDSDFGGDYVPDDGGQMMANLKLEDIYSEEEIQHQQLEEEARLRDQKNNIARFNTLNDDQKLREAKDNGFSSVEKYMQVLLGAKVTPGVVEDEVWVEENEVEEDNYIDANLVDDWVSQDGGQVRTDLMTTEDKQAEHEARQLVDFDMWLRDKNDGDYMSFWQGVEGGIASFFGEVGDFVSAPFSKEAWENYSLGNAVERQQIKYIEEQKHLYEIWKNQYATDDPNAFQDETTLDNYFKKKIINEELYDEDT